MRKDSDVKAGRIATTAIAVAAAAVVILPAGTARATTFANLAAANASAVGTPVTVDNVTISDILSSTGTSFNLVAQDSSAGTELFSFPTAAFSGFTPAIGDVVDVTATNDPFHANNEFANSVSGFTNPAASVTLDSTGTFTPQVVTTTQANTAAPGGANAILLNETVTLDNVTITPVTAGQTTFVGNGSYDATDSLGTTILFINNASSNSVVGAFIGQAIPTGPVNVTGFVDNFSGTIEINPTSIVSAVPEPASLGLLAAAGTLMAVKRRARRA